MIDGTFQIITTGLTVVGGLSTAYIVNVLAKRRPPRDRMDVLFEGYERLIAQQQKEISRLKSQLNEQNAKK